MQMNKIQASDVKSGFLIFLIALPLCLGISMASSFPAVAGIFTAIVGGILSTFIGSSRLSIKGPAAGLIVVILMAVQELGQGDPVSGYKKCLAVGVAAAVIQIVFSKLKVGRVGALIPSAVIHGMLAAIGVIIMAKQFHILLGVIPHGKTPIELIRELPLSLANCNPEIALIGLLALGTFILWPSIPLRFTKRIPPALVSLMVVVPLALIWHLDEPHQYSLFHHTYESGPGFLVFIPHNIFKSFVFPDFSVLLTPVAWKHVVMLAVIGSLESILTVTAIDSLDPEKQVSNLDADLFSVGVGNLVCSMIGGLPMISEVVRSKANIDSGAKTSASNFFHGVFLLLAVVLFPNVLHEVPLAALAAMLMFTGYRLASPKEIYRQYEIGLDHLFLFLVTLLTTLYTDLLIGVLSGLALKLGLDYVRGLKVSVQKIGQ